MTVPRLRIRTLMVATAHLGAMLALSAAVRPPTFAWAGMGPVATLLVTSALLLTSWIGADEARRRRWYAGDHGGAFVCLGLAILWTSVLSAVVLSCIYWG